MQCLANWHLWSYLWVLLLPGLKNSWVIIVFFSSVITNVRYLFILPPTWPPPLLNYYLKQRNCNMWSGRDFLAVTLEQMAATLHKPTIFDWFLQMGKIVLLTEQKNNRILYFMPLVSRLAESFSIFNFTMISITRKETQNAI